MGIGAFTRYIDLAQVVLYVFWFFFFGLIMYLRREDKREGYPLETDGGGTVRVQGFPSLPTPKVFKLRDGTTRQVPPAGRDTRPLAAQPANPWRGAPLQPSGNPLADAVGPAAYADRDTHPDLTIDGEPKIVPLRTAAEFFIAPEDPDPRGMEVIAADRKLAGRVSDVWIDKAEPQIRYLEVEVGAAEGKRTVLLPINFTRIKGMRRQVKVVSLLAEQFAGVPATAQWDRITLREEDQITAYYGGGTLYAEPSRLGPLV